MTRLTCIEDELAEQKMSQDKITRLCQARPDFFFIICSQICLFKNFLQHFLFQSFSIIIFVKYYPQESISLLKIQFLLHIASKWNPLIRIGFKIYLKFLLQFIAWNVILYRGEHQIFKRCNMTFLVIEDFSLSKNK